MTELHCIVYKILTQAQWQSFQHRGVFEGSPVDIADGYIHLSDETQIDGVRERHFGGQTDLVLVAIDTRLLTQPVRWESGRSPTRYPHYYGTIALTAVTQVRELR